MQNEGEGEGELKSELQRQFRVVDQMVTMHSSLRDQYLRCSRLLDYTLLGGSIILNGFVFAGDDIYSVLGLVPSTTRVGLGIVSLLILVGSVLAAILNLSARVRNHQDAAQRLSELKLKFRVYFLEPFDVERGKALTGEFHRIVTSIASVPDRQFNKLKSQHVKKVALSKAIDAHPGAPLVLLKAKVCWAGIRTIFRKQ